MNFAVAIVSEDGKVKIPEDMRKQLRIAAGDKLVLSVDEKGQLVFRKAQSHWRELKGIAARPGQQAISIEEMDEDVRSYVAGKVMQELEEAKKRS